MSVGGLRLPGGRVWDWGRLLATSANLTLAGVLAWSLAELTWWLVPSVENEHRATEWLRGPASVSSTERQSARLAELHLFGHPEAPARETQPPRPPATPGLVLRGVVLSENPDKTRAIIGDAGGTDRAYAGGAELPQGLHLVAIHPDRVILEGGGQHKVLLLDPESPEGSDAEGYQRLDNTGDRALARNLGQYQRTLQQNPEGILGLLSVEPVQRSGELHGYRLQPGRDAGFLDLMGLEPGDILKEINGIRLNSPARSLDVLRELSVAEQLRVDVQRGERRILLTYRIEH